MWLEAPRMRRSGRTGIRQAALSRARTGGGAAGAGALQRGAGLFTAHRPRERRAGDLRRADHGRPFPYPFEGFRFAAEDSAD
jgi:hypothetical protein